MKSDRRIPIIHVASPTQTSRPNGRKVEPHELGAADSQIGFPDVPLEIWGEAEGGRCQQNVKLQNPGAYSKHAQACAPLNTYAAP